MRDDRLDRRAFLQNSMHKAFSLHGDTADYKEIEDRIISGAEVKGTNLSVLILAALIACIGLNMNSTAVIIGAMLISPLMGGIMAIGYGLATSDLKESRNAGLGLSIQIITCLIIAVCYFTLSPIKTPTDEILARTTPSIWDVMIACLGGLAGMIGNTRKEKSNVIPGVAIATALMPPLCTAGYGIAQGNLHYFLGALYLFTINAYFICLTSAFVLLVINVPKRSNILSVAAATKLKKKIIRNTIILIIPSLFFGYQMVAQEMAIEDHAVAVSETLTTDIENITKQIQIIYPDITSIQMEQIAAYDRENGVKQQLKAVIITSKNIDEKSKKIIQELLEVPFDLSEILFIQK